MEQLVQIGKTAKAHGLDGGLRFAIDEKYLEDFFSVEVVFIQEKGQPVPYFIEEIKGQHLVVMLEGIESRELAMNLASKQVFIREDDLIPEEEKLYQPDSLEYAPCIGFMMQDEQLGNLGKILDIESYPQQEMAQIEYKGKEILVPMLPNFIIDINESEQLVKVSLPEGMIAVQL